eukprot:1186452-Prorocentrum_minimum.AAC.4
MPRAARVFLTIKDASALTWCGGIGVWGGGCGPASLSTCGLPIGLQLIAPRFAERMLLHVGQVMVGAL